MRLIATFFVFLLASIPLRAEPTGLDLYVIAGQSNVSGRDTSFSLPQSYADGIANSYVYNDSWHQGRVKSDDQVGETRSILRDAVTGVTLSITLTIERQAATGNPVGIVTCAKGGTSAYDWRVGGGSLIAACIARVKEAMPGNTIKGLVWYQGEAERDEPYSNLVRFYQRTINTLVEFRTQIGGAFPIVVVGIGDHTFPLGDVAYAWQSVQQLQRQLAEEMPDAAFVSAAGLPLMDSVHLTGAANLTLGEMVAEAFAQFD